MLPNTNLSQWTVIAGYCVECVQLQGDWVNIAVFNVDVDKYRTYLMTVKVSDHDQQKIIVETTLYRLEGETMS
jgi:hypothetical protein